MSGVRKEYYEYIVSTKKPHVTLQKYSEEPATAFLSAIVEAKRAADLCAARFTKNNSGTYTTPSQNSLQIVNAGLLAYIMGQFETYQKYLFAQMFEYTVYLNKFNVESFLKHLVEQTQVNIEMVRFAGYRDKPHSVGLVLAENLKNWQSPHKVNSYFKAFELKDSHGRSLQFFSNDNIKDLQILWQMRHSIVHTASTITLPDSQKIEYLHQYGNKSIILKERFIPEVVRKFHPLIKEATGTSNSRSHSRAI